MGDAGRFDGEVPEGGSPDASSDARVLDGASSDGGSSDGGSSDGGSSDGAISDGGSSDGAISDGGSSDGAPTTDASDRDAGPACGDCGDLTCCDAVCVDVTSDDAHCGACGAACLIGDRCALGVCAPRCEAPTVWCGSCVTLTDDPDHCGSCGNRCPSGICEDGVCVGFPVGHVVLVGHSYAESRSTIRRVVGNSVWLAPGSDINVLVYEGDAGEASLRAVDRAIDENAVGRTWNRFVLAGDLGSALAQAQVLVVHAQQAATNEGLFALGESWAPTLEPFLVGGGVLVVLDGEGDHGGTWQILEGAGLISIDARVPLGLDTVDVVAPGDAVARRLPTRYRAEPESAAFVGAPPAETVVAHGSGAVVVHHVVVAP